MNHSFQQSGQQLIGNAANGLKSFSIQVKFPTPFEVEPIVHVTMCGDGFFDDACVTTVHSSDKNGFSVSITRVFDEIQSVHWTQDLSIFWIARAMDEMNGRMMFCDVEENEETVLLEIPIESNLYAEHESLPRVMVSPYARNEFEVPYAVLQVREIRRDRIIVSTRLLQCPQKNFEINFSLFHHNQPTIIGKSNIVLLGDVVTENEITKRTVRFSTAFPVPPHIIAIPVCDPHYLSSQIVVVNVQNVTPSSFTVIIRKMQRSESNHKLYLHYYAQIPLEYENAIDTSELFTSITSSWSRPSLAIRTISPSKNSLLQEQSTASFALDSSAIENSKMLEELGIFLEEQNIPDVEINLGEDHEGVEKNREETATFNDITLQEVIHSPIIRELEYYPSPISNQVTYKYVTTTVTTLSPTKEIDFVNGTLNLEVALSETCEPDECVESTTQDERQEENDNQNFRKLIETIPEGNAPQVSRIVELSDMKEILADKDTPEHPTPSNDTSETYDSFQNHTSSLEETTVPNQTTPVKSSRNSSLFSSPRSEERRCRHVDLIFSSPRGTPSGTPPISSPVRSIITRLRAETFGSNQVEIVREYMGSNIILLTGTRMIDILQAISLESNRFLILGTIIDSNNYLIDGFDITRILKLFVLASRKREVLNKIFSNSKIIPTRLNCGSSVTQILQQIPLESHKLEVLQLMADCVSEKTNLSLSGIYSQFTIKANALKAQTILERKDFEL